MADVFSNNPLDLVALLDHYKKYLQRLKEKGLNPWQGQPRRKTDHQLVEAVGHFHLYAWLLEATRDLGVVSPEFPTGNGKVDLHIKAGDKEGMIEVKSLQQRDQIEEGSTGRRPICQRLGLGSGDDGSVYSRDG